MGKKIIIYIIIFTLSLISLLLFFILDSKQSYIKMSQTMLFQEALSQYKSMIITRQWNSDHNSVYVKQTSKIKPNPYLKDNFLLTNKNEVMVRINPAWMTRQISELLNKDSTYKYKITSLLPINPQNEPDDFERTALKHFAKNKNEKYYTELAKDKFNFMGALKVKPSCLACHIEQEYKVGDIRGGLRISIPLNNYNKSISEISKKTNTLYLISIFASLILLAILIYTFKLISKKQNQIKNLNNILENRVKERTLELEKKSDELKQSNDKLLELSRIDFLTKLANRRYFFNYSNQLFSSLHRNNNKLSLVVIDIDYFKNINDTYGHNIGDLALIQIAGLLKHSIRESDFCARLGGEEFVIILNNSDIKSAYIFCEKIRTKVKETVFILEENKIKITISLGIEEYNEKHDSINDIVNNADKALYEAKAQGRDRTVLFMS